MDHYKDRVPVCTFSSGTNYDGRVWYELLSSIRYINDKPVEVEEKSMLKSGDRVTLEYKTKTYHGIVDTQDEPVKPRTPGKMSCEQEDDHTCREAPTKKPQSPETLRKNDPGPSRSPGVQRRASPRKRKLDTVSLCPAKKRLFSKKTGTLINV